MRAARDAILFGGSSVPYDARVEYLESTGTQWIDTPVIARPNLVISCTFRRTTLPTQSNDVVYGAFLTTNQILTCGGGNSSGHFTWCPCITNKAPLAYDSNVDVDTGWHTTEMSTTDYNRYVKFDGVTTATDSSHVGSSPTATVTISLFSRAPYNSGSVRVNSSCQIASFSVMDVATGSVLTDMVAVRFTDGNGVTEGVMFDRVNPTVGMDPDGSARDDGIYRNRGTGTFLYGSDR